MFVWESCTGSQKKVGIKIPEGKKKTSGDIFLKAYLALLDCGSNEHSR